jgi:hypothetical protein
MPVAVSEPTTAEPLVYPGDRVYFWTSRTGTQPHTGEVCTAELVCGVTYAEIRPDLPPHMHVFLLKRAVCGFEPMREGL